MTSQHRSGIFNQLKIISEPTEQYAYERAVPIANVPSELICQWDEYYRRFKRDDYRSAFSKSEQKAIATFHEYFDKHAESFPQDDGIDGLQKSPAWQEFQENARELISALGGTTDSSRDD